VSDAGYVKSGRPEEYIADGIRRKIENMQPTVQSESHIVAKKKKTSKQYGG
jgi:hypothetical protein